jgi:hypothetical protein
MALFDNAKGREIKPEELVAVVIALVKQMGGSVVLDAADLGLLRNQSEVLKIETMIDPWALVFKVVKDEGNV